MSFPQFAFNNVKRNARAYFAYYLSSSFMVMVFFTYALFIFHPDINKTELGHTTMLVMLIMEYIIYIFSFLFVLYSIGAFLKARNKEFGILTILGAEQGQISRLVFIENMIIGASSIVTGIGSGLILSKLFLLLSAKVVGMDKLGLYLPVKAVLLTVAAFALLFIAISAFTLILIRRNHVLHLLQGSNRPKTEPKASILISLFGIALLAAGYMSLRLNLVLAAVTGIAGTYFFFTQITVLVMRLLKRSRRWVWKGTNLIWISEMAYKMKDNARVLFMVTVVTAISCMSVAFVMSINETNKDNYRANPYAIRLSVYDDTSVKGDLALIEQSLSSQGINYQTIRSEQYFSVVGERTSSVSVMPRSMYNRLAEAVGAPKVGELHLHQAVHVIPATEVTRERPDWYDLRKITLRDTKAELDITGTIKPEVNVSPTVSDMLIVSDEEFQAHKKLLSSEPEPYRIQGSVVYLIPEWSTGTIPAEGDPEISIGMKLKQEGIDRELSGQSENIISARGGDYYSLRQSFAMMSFAGIFITAVLSISSASFLYFKLHHELTQDQRMYQSMSKIGLKIQEMSRAATLQIAALFFVPIVVSVIQTLVVLNAVRKDFGVGEVNSSVLIASIAFVIVQMVYFLIVRSRYVHKLKRVMV